MIKIIINIKKTNLHKLYPKYKYKCKYIQVTLIYYFILTLNWSMVTKWYKAQEIPLLRAMDLSEYV